jgi:hypothetical protein
MAATTRMRQLATAMSAGNTRFDMNDPGTEGSENVYAWIVASRVVVVVRAREGKRSAERPRFGAAGTADTTS